MRAAAVGDGQQPLATAVVLHALEAVRSPSGRPFFAAVEARRELVETIQPAAARLGGARRAA